MGPLNAATGKRVPAGGGDTLKGAYIDFQVNQGQTQDRSGGRCILKPGACVTAKGDLEQQGGTWNRKQPKSACVLDDNLARLMDLTSEMKHVLHSDSSDVTEQRFRTRIWMQRARVIEPLQLPNCGLLDGRRRPGPCRA